MASVKYDVTDVEAGGGEQAQPAIYAGKVISATLRDKKANGEPANDIELVISVGEKYAPLWTYVNLESVPARWKVREFTDAFGLPAKGELNTQKLKALEGKPVTVKVSADTDLDGNYRGRVKNLMKPGSVEDVVDESATATNGAPEDYSTWTPEDLEAEITERGLTLPSGRKTADKLIAVLLAADISANGDGDGEAVAEAGATGEADEYDTWTADDLLAEIKERGIDGNVPAVSGRKTADKMKAAYIVALRADDESGGGGEAATVTVEDDYDEWPDNELLDEINTRIGQGADIKIAGRKTKDKMIAALREDDAASPDPF